MDNGQWFLVMGYLLIVNRYGACIGDLEGITFFSISNKVHL